MKERLDTVGWKHCQARRYGVAIYHMPICFLLIKEGIVYIQYRRPKLIAYDGLSNIMSSIRLSEPHLPTAPNDLRRTPSKKRAA